MEIDFKLHSTELKITLPNGLHDLSYEQFQAKKDIELILRDSGLVIYGIIGLENPKI